MTRVRDSLEGRSISLTSPPLEQTPIMDAATLTKKQLLDIAERYGITVPSKATKDEILELLE